MVAVQNLKGEIIQLILGRFLYTPQTLFARGIMNRKMIGEAIYIRVSDRK
jgi:hypothetical protein